MSEIEERIKREWLATHAKTGFEDLYEDEWDRMIEAVRAEEREQDAREPSEPVRVQIAGQGGGKHSILADMIVERANTRGVRVEFVEPDREPSDAEVEAAGEAVWDKYGDAGSSTWDNALPREKAWARGTARAALLAAQEVRRNGGH